MELLLLVSIFTVCLNSHWIYIWFSALNRILTIALPHALLNLRLETRYL
jgi:hypothetical protein